MTKFLPGHPEEDQSTWGSQHRLFSSVQLGMGGVGVLWGLGEEFQEGGRGAVLSVPRWM